MNRSIELLKAAFLKRKLNPTSISPQAEEMCNIIDGFAEKHCFDRDRYDERIKKLEETVARLEKASQPE